jgi:hypothetical protein
MNTFISLGSEGMRLEFEVTDAARTVTDYGMRRALEDVKNGRVVNVDSNNFDADIDALFGKKFAVRPRKMKRRQKK